MQKGVKGASSRHIVAFPAPGYPTNKRCYQYTIGFSIMLLFRKKPEKAVFSKRKVQKMMACLSGSLNPLPNTVNLYTPALTGFQHQRPEERETTALVIALKARLRTGHRLNRKTPERRCFID